MSLEPAQLRQTLASIIDPVSKKDIVTAGMVKDIKENGDDICIEISLDSSDQALQLQLKEQIEVAIRGAGQKHQTLIGGVEIKFTQDTRKANDVVKEEGNPLPNVKNIIAVGAGKGGVGKSTVSALLAVGLAKTGSKVGLLDGDIYGPSMTTMLGIRQEDDRIPSGRVEDGRVPR